MSTSGNSTRRAKPCFKPENGSYRQLTGGVAHDFNNLLMAILGSLEIIQRRLPADSPLTPFVENALKGAKRGSALTKRMLAFARRQELKVTGVDVAALVTGMSDMLERSLGPSILLTFDLTTKAPLATADPAQLENAILNLPVNARDAMPRGGKITISTKVKNSPVASEGKARCLPDRVGNGQWRR